MFLSLRLIRGRIFDDLAWSCGILKRAMDFLNPRKERFHRAFLITSYCLIGIAIALLSWVLLKQTDGYCFSRDGTVNRCGLVFVSSQPKGADVFIDGVERSFRTNGKINLQSGEYAFRVSRTGYQDWKRTITVVGGDVQRFDYPILFPNKLKTTNTLSFTGQLAFLTQSPSRRWLVGSEVAAPSQIQVIDLRNNKDLSSETVSIESSVFTVADSVQSWKVVEWSSDERHFLTLRSFTAEGSAAQEYIVMDRAGTQVRNVTRELQLQPTDQVHFFDKKYDKFYVYNTETKGLRTARLGGEPPTSLQLNRVFAYKTYGDDTVLYVTDAPLGGTPKTGSVSVVLQQGTRSSMLRQLPVAERYVLDIAQYEGKWYVVAGSSALKGVYVFRNPLDAVLARPTDTPHPFRFLRLVSPQYVAFSANARFIVAANRQNHAVYDLEQDDTYLYKAIDAIDPPQEHATWMDGDRLSYISAGKVVVYEYDNINRRVLQPGLPEYGVFFAPDYRYGYTVRSSGSGAPELAQTAYILP
ncbi:hypothetical protein CSA80_02080 [Candidatus Saccharibacteria bacterium]|nr:MAG: hypothetical protein CSA80_02080 [Candidatus Saccharibacteria bacterium]